jgi:GNAT superfamily N-acetyltransferase
VRRALTRTVYAKWISCIGREPKPMTADYDAAVRDHWIDLLDEDGRLVGLIEMMPAPDHLWIQNIAVRESAQGKGFGKMLLAHANGVARRIGVPEIRLNTNAAFTANLGFYARAGFAETRREQLPDGGTAVFFARPVS